MKIFFIFWLALSSRVWADDVEIRVEPNAPTVDTSFNIIFEIETTREEEPYISFDSPNVSILGRSVGQSISTQLINGQFSTRKIFKAVYSAEVDRPGSFTIKNIKIDIGGSKLNHQNVQFKVYKDAPTPTSIVLVAEASKDKVYQGEGFYVKYNLYYLDNLQQVEVQEFPKLNGFLKRFHMPDERPETVQYQGSMFRRSTKYSAKLFPEKSGKATVDPLRLVIQYITGGGSPFGFSGFGLQQVKTKTIRSAPVEIEVMPLPTENVPTSFVGLVGKHEFKLTFSRDKFLVNEVIEAKLEVTGPGALENIKLPPLINRPELESFDTKSEVAEIDKSTARKTVEYTYLAREPFTSSSQKWPISYFDPDTATYVTVELEIPALTVAGKANPGVSSADPDDKPAAVTPSPVVEVEKVQGLVAPDFSVTSGSMKSIVNLIFYSLLALIIMVVAVALGFRVGQNFSGKHDSLFTRVSKKGFDYSDFFHLFKRFENSGQKGLKDIIRGLELTEEAKGHFLETLSKVEEGYFKKRGAQRIKVPKRFLGELLKIYEGLQRHQ